MADLSDFKRDQMLVLVWQVLVSQKPLNYFGVARTTVSKVMIAFEKEGKTSSLKQNSGRKRKLSNRDR